MILKKQTISKLNMFNKNGLFLVSVLGVLAAVGIVSYVQPFSVYAIAESQNSKINWYDKALVVNQNNVPALVEKGTDLVAQGMGKEALPWLDRALSIDGQNMMGLVSKATALKELGRYQEAIATYDSVLAIDPHDAYAIGGKADSLYMSGQHEQAITWIDKALEMNPSDAKIQFVQESLHQQIN